MLWLRTLIRLMQHHCTFMRPLMRRMKEEVVAATFDIIAQVHSMAGCRPEVVRLHSDNAAEFVSATMRDEAAKRGLYKTTSVPYEHASNGRAERAIRYLKEKANKYILESGAPSEIWPYALAEAALVQRAEVMGAKCMKGQPVPWTTVAITKHGARKQKQRVFFVGMNIPLAVHLFW